MPEILMEPVVALAFNACLLCLVTGHINNNNNNDRLTAFDPGQPG